MEKPRHISSGEAMRWNADVERRRREYHERRCAEDPIYKRAYERRQEMMHRMQKMHDVTMAQLQNAMSEPENTKCQQASDQMTVTEEPQKVKMHEEVMRERSLLLERVEQYGKAGAAGVCECALSAGMMAMFFDPNAEQRLKEMQEEKPYADEIRRTDARFDKELIRMSGFEW